MTNSVAKQGFSFPAEWREHKSTWLTWPVPHVVWEDRLDATRNEFAELVACIARFEPVNLIVRDDEALSSAEAKLNKTSNGLKNVQFHRIPVDDCWLRDNGPLFVTNKNGDVALTDWQFNAWGEEYEHWDLDNAVPSAIAKILNMTRFDVPMILEGGSIDVNSQGICLSTKSCLLNKNRNPNLSQGQVERHLKDTLNIQEILWLEQGFKDDETDGHIDLVARFVNDNTILCCICEDKTDENYQTFQTNFEQLKARKDFMVVPLPIPKRKMMLDGERVALSYANFFMGNGFIVVPTYNDENDARALAVIAEHCPKHEVIGLSAESMITGGGSVHCVTQQEPKGR